MYLRKICFFLKYPSKDEIDQFLDNITLPKLTDNQAMALDSPLTSDELQEALNSMPNKKAPGPDGFPAEFYKEFWAILAPTFYRMLQETKENGRLPPNMNSANISLLLNQAKTLYCLLAIVQYPLLMWTLK